MKVVEQDWFNKIIKDVGAVLTDLNIKSLVELDEMIVGLSKKRYMDKVSELENIVPPERRLIFQKLLEGRRQVVLMKNETSRK